MASFTPQMPFMQNTSSDNQSGLENSRNNRTSFTFPLNNVELGNLIRQCRQNLVITSNNETFNVDSGPQQPIRRISLSTLLSSHNTSESSNSSSQSGGTFVDSVIINLENVASNNNTPQNNNSVNILENVGNRESNRNEDDLSADTLRHVLETHQTLQVFLKYIPFILILLAKCLYDNGEEILNFIILFTTFTHCNSVLKKETAKQSGRNLSKLLLAIAYILVCLVFIHYVIGDDKLYSYLVLAPPTKLPSSVWNLLWTIAVADFILKLITIIFKIFLASLPPQIIQFQKRGKYFLFLEAFSQLYRSLVPIQLWLHYLLDFYHGAEKIIGVILSAAYMVSKGSDLMARLKLFKQALFKLIQNVTLGSSPNKDQLQKAGNQCPICHDEYSSPVVLQCKHIFCETCVTTWFDREQTCPLCRAKIVDDPSWRDGSTTFFIQLF